MAGAKKKPKPKYDWIKIKLEFFKSGHNEVAPFLKEKYNIERPFSGAINKQVVSWKKEKLEIKKRGLEKAKKQIEDLYVPTAKELADMHKSTILLAKATLQNELERCIDKATGKVKKGTDTLSLLRLWQMIKAEKLEPTAVHKNENTIDDELKESLAFLLDQNYEEDDQAL